jgi:hypothetical protein
MPPLKKFKIHWMHGETQIIEGYTISAAFNTAGFGQGALRALDYWEEIKEGKEE